MSYCSNLSALSPTKDEEVAQRKQEAMFIYKQRSHRNKTLVLQTYSTFKPK